MFYPAELLCCLSVKFSASIDSVVKFDYMLIFQIADDVVYADYVVDCRQDYGWLIR